MILQGFGSDYHGAYGRMIEFHFVSFSTAVILARLKMCINFLQNMFQKKNDETISNIQLIFRSELSSFHLNSPVTKFHPPPSQQPEENLGNISFWVSLAIS